MLSSSGRSRIWEGGSSGYLEDEAGSEAEAFSLNYMLLLDNPGIPRLTNFSPAIPGMVK